MISSGTVKIVSTAISNLNIDSKKNNIIDNIKKEWNNINNIGLYIQTQSINTTINNSQFYNNTSNGIYVYGQSKYITINNTQVYNNNSYWIYINQTANISGYNIINNVQSFNNGGYWMYLVRSSNNFVNNSQFYNNESVWFATQLSSSNSINNSQFYNNTTHWIYFNEWDNNVLNNSLTYNNISNGLYINWSSNNVINNIQSYDNGIGILLSASPSTLSRNNIFNNIEVFNNNIYWISISSTYRNYITNNKYYGYFNIYENIDNTGNINNLYITTARDVYFTWWISLTWLDRSSGIFSTTWTINWNKAINPRDGSGIYLLDQFLVLTQKNITSWSWIPAVVYSYWSQVSTQTQPVRYNSWVVEYYSWDWDSSKYIWWDDKILSGSMEVVWNTTLDPNIILTFTSVNNLNWRIFGNILSEKTWTINANSSITTWVTLSLAEAKSDKDIFVQFWTWEDYTHYYDTIRYISWACLFSRNNDNFIDQTFWDKNPSTENIICALYWSWWSDKTAYTENRSWYNNECLNNTVIYTNTLPTTLLSNTTYILASWNYNISSIINFNNCWAFISSGTATITSTTSSNYIYINSRKNNIIDNIKINWNNNNNTNGIYINTQSNYNTLNNIQTYNNTNGIYINTQSNYNTINNVKAYNNSNWIQINASSGNIINNSQTYNNAQWMYLYYGSNNIINNSQAYNNTTYWVNIYSSNNVLNNIQSYNNNIGIYFSASSSVYSRNNIFNNIDVYNNTWYWISITSTYRNSVLWNKYYGYLNVYGNTNNLNITTTRDRYLTWWLAWEILDRSKWSFKSSSIVDWNKITNPRNGSGIYLLDQFLTITRSNIPSWSWIPEIIYSYWSQISPQTQPVRYNSWLLEYYWSAWSSWKYIWSNNTILSWSIQSDWIFTETTNTTLTFTSTNNVNWIIFGDIIEIKTWSINANSSIITWIILSGDEWPKKIYIQFWTGSDYTHYYTTINYVHAPTVQTWYIFSWSTGSFNANNYFKDMITIRANISDAIWIKTWSCEYSIVGIWLPASWTQTYCEAKNITPIQNINILFRVKNNGNNIWVWITGTYLLDNTCPSISELISPINDQSFNNTNINFQWNSTTDTWIWLSWYIYQISTTSNFSSIVRSWALNWTSVSVSWLDNITYYRRVLSIDLIWNITNSRTETFTINTAYINVPNTTNTNVIASEFLSWWYTDSTWSVKWLLSWYLIGNKKIRVADSDGKLLVPLVLQSSGLEDKIEVQIPEWTTIKTASWNNYTWILDVPVLLDTWSADLIWSDVSSVASFWWSKSMIFNDLESTSQPVTIRIPVPNLTQWDLVVVYYSNNDWDSWTVHTWSKVISLDWWIPYVEFITTHFTDFAIAGTTWSLSINNNANSTISQNVTINIYAPTAQKMRFSNDNILRTNRETYATSKSWQLLTGLWTKTVYAEFDLDWDNNPDIPTSDSIDYILQPPAEWNISLEILSWVSECIYGTILELWIKDVSFNQWYISWDFIWEWSCTDYTATSSARQLTIQSSDLENWLWNKISSGFVEINHSDWLLSWDPLCKAWIATWNNRIPINSTYTLIERWLSGSQVCSVTIPTVSLQIHIPAGQAPGTYSGELTIYIPNF